MDAVDGQAPPLLPDRAGHQAKAIDRFALETHTTPYEQWPPRSRLIVDGVMTQLGVPGYTLLRQFETRFGYLLVCDSDCPYEEATTFILLNFSHDQVLSSRTLGGRYVSFLLDSMEWRGDCTAHVVFHERDEWLMSIRGESCLFKPRIRLRRLAGTSGKVAG